MNYNIKKIVFLILIFVVGINTAQAKDTLMTCEYYKPIDTISGSPQAGVLCDIYNDFSHQCYMQVGSESATRSSNKEKIQNWSLSRGTLNWKAKEYVQNNNKCPDYLWIKIENDINGYEILAAQNMEDLMKLVDNIGGKRYPATLKGNVSEDLQKKARENIISWTEAINNFVSNYSITNCMEAEKVITKYSKCKDILFSLKTNIATWNNEVNNYMNQGYLNAQDTLVEKYNEAVKNAEEFIKNAEEEIEKGNKEIQEELGIDDGNNKTESGTLTPIKKPGISFEDLCKQDGVKNALQFIGYLLYVVKVLVPALLIIFGIIDFSKATISSDADALQKSTKSLVIRVIAGIAIFIIPTIVNFVFGTIVSAESSYGECRICIFSPNNCEK